MCPINIHILLAFTNTLQDKGYRFIFLNFYMWIMIMIWDELAIPIFCRLSSNIHDVSHKMQLDHHKSMLLSYPVSFISNDIF